MDKKPVFSQKKLLHLYTSLSFFSTPEPLSITQFTLSYSINPAAMVSPSALKTTLAPFSNGTLISHVTCTLASIPGAMIFGLFLRTTLLVLSNTATNFVMLAGTFNLPLCTAMCIGVRWAKVSTLVVKVAVLGMGLDVGHRISPARS